MDLGLVHVGFVVDRVALCQAFVINYNKYLFNCNWAVTRWQWLVYMYTGFTTKF